MFSALVSAWFHHREADDVGMLAPSSATVVNVSRGRAEESVKVKVLLCCSFLGKLDIAM